MKKHETSKQHISTSQNLIKYEIFDSKLLQEKLPFTLSYLHSLSLSSKLCGILLDFYDMLSSALDQLCMCIIFTVVKLIIIYSTIYYTYCCLF